MLEFLLAIIPETAELIDYSLEGLASDTGNKKFLGGLIIILTSLDTSSYDSFDSNYSTVFVVP